MVWGCITENGPGRLIWIKDTMTGLRYTKILEEGLWGLLDDQGIPRDLDTFYTFQQDNDPKHESKSPDMNIIKNVWNFVETQIRRRSPLPNSVDQLWVALQEEWSRIPIEYINKLYDSLPRRVSDVIAANGGATRY
ncbi:hypothetical protein F5050DRAFT_1801908 [Lentinula boryana]|uniref:Uncharacterized protein n=1 Tax=Lentinula boryana TaxID=40481 RepID=A0ABQ8Q0A7_9AGAR|nr:hypothetical protein F5050DRAFT_1801908 [Lentinula boryana]